VAATRTAGVNGATTLVVAIAWLRSSAGRNASWRQYAISWPPRQRRRAPTLRTSASASTQTAPVTLAVSARTRTDHRVACGLGGL